MRRLLLLLLASCNIIYVLAQENVKTPIVQFEGSYIGDNAFLIDGGMKQGYTYLGLADMSLSFDTKAAGLWKGGELLIHGSNSHGGKPTEEFIGDYQGISNIEAGDHTFLYELWYRQNIGPFSATVGLQDLNAEFAVSEYGGLFLNGSFGIPPVIGDNTNAPIFPITGLGITLQYKLLSDILIKTALYDGTLTDFDKNPYNTKWSLSSNDGVSSYTELSISKEIVTDLNSHISLGYFTNSITEEILSDENVNQKQSVRKMGLYFIADQQILNSDKYRLGSFLQASYAQKQEENNFWYLGAGMYVAGTGKYHNEAGIAIASTGFGNKTSETTIEASYKFSIFEILYIQPDIQYIIYPGGKSSGIKNALAGIVRWGIEF